jgi:hypothetical protein
MGKSLGITAFVLLLISLPIPVLGNYVSLLALLILAGSAWAGECQWVVIVDLLAWVKMFLLSPTWHLMMFGGGYMRGVERHVSSLGTVDLESRALIEGSTNAMSGMNTMTLIVTVAILSAPVAIMLWRSSTSASAKDRADA